MSELAQLAATNQWGAIHPEVFLGGLALMLLILEWVLPASRQVWLPRLAIFGQLVAVALVVAAVVAKSCAGAPQPVLFGGLIAQTPVADFFRAFFPLAGALVCALGTVVLPRQEAPRTEFYHLVLVATAGLMLLAQASHFISLFVSLELVTVCLYVLVAFFRRRSESLEAGLKYLILGGLSSGVMLFGIALLYGAAGTPGLAGATDQAMSFSGLGRFLALNPGDPLARIGVVLVLSGLAFKIGAFPFQMWVPDVYQGAPTPVTALLAVASKAAGFSMLLTLVHGPFAPLAEFLRPILAVGAGASILFGNLAALTQNNLKRLLGLSGVSHAGYLLLGVAASLTPEVARLATGAVLFYLLAYLLASFAVFAVLAYVSGEDDSGQLLHHHEALARRSPLLAGVLLVGLGSLAGIPPLAGFIGKLAIFVAALKAGLHALVAVAVVGVVLSIYYYFKWIKTAWFAEAKVAVPEEQRTAEVAITAPGCWGRWTLAGLSLATVLLGLFQGPLGHWFGGR